MTLFGWVRLGPILTEMDTKTLYKCVIYDQSIMIYTAGSWHYIGPSQFLNVRTENKCYWINCFCFRSNFKKKKTRKLSKTTNPFFFESAIIGVNRVLKFGFLWEKIYQCRFSYLVDTWYIIHNGPFFALMIMDMKFVSTVFCSNKMTYRSGIS